MTADPTHLRLLAYALKNHENQIESMSQGQCIGSMARQNDKRPANMLLYVPDEWIKNLKGNDVFQDVYLFMRIPREVYDEWKNPETKMIVESSGLVDLNGMPIGGSNFAS